MRPIARATGLPSFILNTLIRVGFLVLMALPAKAGEYHLTVSEGGGEFFEHALSQLETQEHQISDWHYGAYLDLGYAVNFNDPRNGVWRSKSTTFEVDEPRVNMAMGYLRKESSPQSRWGMEFGVQGGVDTKKLAPDDDEAISNADFYRHLYRANVSYLFAVGNGLEVTGGLINSYIGYESYLAVENPNYTRGYLTDNVPFFFFGVNTNSFPLKDKLNLAFYTVNGWSYLANLNDQPSWGLQMKWKPSTKITFTQNLYYGPDQGDTALQYWRFFSDSIMEWKNDPFLLALSLDVGTEKQAEQSGRPRYSWMAGALWARWQISEPLSLAVRPEFYSDPDGLITGAEQFIQAYTATLKYQFSPLAHNKLVASLEYRFDRSTGSEGGFFRGSDNRLVPNQHLLIFALMWSFGQ